VRVNRKSAEFISNKFTYLPSHSNTDTQLYISVEMMMMIMMMMMMMRVWYSILEFNVPLDTV